MAKVKNKRNSGLADKVHGKRKGDINKKKLNPFEVHINKEKIKVLGKKSKHDRGLPGVSRAKAIQKRKETLGTEMKLMNKTNEFIDRRIGEKNNQLSAEDRMIARFAAERAKQHSKKNIYNLADDEILTHRGQTLEQIEKFDDPKSSDDEDDEGAKKFGGLDDQFVAEGHFGGGMLSKSEKDGAKSHKDLIEQLIAESKKRKAEKQKEKEQTLDLTEKLDSEWKDLQPVVFKRARVEEKEESLIDKLLSKAENKAADYDKMMRELRFEKRGTEKEESLIDKLLSKAENKAADYDKMMRELRFEKRGTPSDGLKTDEKQAKEEKLRLEQLEKEREQRMLGESETGNRAQPAAKHRSADDLDDNFELEDEKEFMLAYDNDGKPLVPEHVLNDYSVPNAKPKYQDGVSDTSSDDDNEEEEEDDNEENDGEESDNDEKNNEKNSEVQSDESDDSESENNDNEPEIQKTTVKKPESKEKNSQKNSEVKKDESDDSETDNDDNVQKTIVTKPENNEKDTQLNNEVQSDESDKDEINKKVTKETKLHKPESKEKLHNVLNISANGSQSDEESSDEEQSDDNDDDKKEFDDLKDLKESDVESEEETEENSEKISSFFDLKNDEGENLKELLTGKTPSQQATALQKLIKSYDPGLAENNKELLSRLYAHMLQYVNDIFTNLQNEGDVLKSILIFDKLAPFFYDLAHTNKVSSKKYLVELQKEKHDVFIKNPKKVPDLDTLIFFKLVSLLYPTSDFRHPVTTPSLIFMSEILSLSKFNNAFSISRGFFIISLILEFTALSKRFVPSAINFLRGILYLSANISVLNPIQVVPPFKQHRDSKLLNLEDDCSKMAVENKMAVKDLVLKTIDNDFKIRCLLNSAVMLKEFFNNCNEMEAQACIFEPLIQLFGRIDLELYPKTVSSTVTKVVQHMKESLEVKTYTPLSREKKKPKALRLYEPDIQDVFTGSKSSKLPREQAERARLQNKVKKEMKGALREIRRDKSYIASVKIRQKIQSDNVRKEKVRQIYKDASIQQGELNKLKRMK